MNIPEERFQLSSFSFEALLNLTIREEALFKILKEHNQTVISLINNYLPGKYRGQQFTISAITFENNRKGKFRMDFTATEYIGCSLSETEMRDYIMVRFSINESGCVTLLGEEMRERDTFEEF